MSVRTTALDASARQQLIIAFCGTRRVSRVLASGAAILVAASCTDLTQPPSPAVSSANGIALAPSASTTTVTFAIEPKSTFLRTEANDVSQASLVLSLPTLGLKDGDYIRLEVVQTPPNATLCQVYAGINNRGETVGKCTVGGVQNGFYWASHTATPAMLPRPPATGDVTPRDINDSGVIDVYGGPNKPLPALWPQGGAYKMLGLGSSGAWGEAMNVVVTPAGLVTTGTQSNQYALRWK
jgi:hypothetical protein